MARPFSQECWCKIRVNGLKSVEFLHILSIQTQPLVLGGCGNLGSPCVYLRLSPTVLIKMGERKFGQ